MTLEAAARRVMTRCDQLAGYSEESGRLTRRFATAPMLLVHEVLTTWMRATGMSVERDALGNLVGRYEAAEPGAKTLLLGSHLDTVRDAGKYDGLLGVMVALTCLERLHARGERLPFAIELLGFADEEGLRYQSVYLGSKAVTGTFDPRALELVDVDGVTLAEAVRLAGGDPDPALLCTPRWARKDLLGYCEVHIEQGPVLEARNLPVAVVTSIVGQRRAVLRLVGEAGHAGTVPMDLRHDALCAAAEFVLAVESLARGVPGLIATVGQMQVLPGAPNVIPGSVQLSLDVRHEDDALREHCMEQLVEQAYHISERRGVACTWQMVQDSRTVTCAPGLLYLLRKAIMQEGYPVYELPSGAGHDAVAMSALTDVALLFVRCRGGISHHPDEAVLEQDVVVALSVLERFLHLYALRGD